MSTPTACTTLPHSARERTAPTPTTPQSFRADDRAQQTVSSPTRPSFSQEVPALYLHISMTNPERKQTQVRRENTASETEEHSGHDEHSKNRIRLLCKLIDVSTHESTQCRSSDQPTNNGERATHREVDINSTEVQCTMMITILGLYHCTSTRGPTPHDREQSPQRSAASRRTQIIT